LLAILIGLGAWAVYDVATGTEQTATQLIDDAAAAWTAPDLATFVDVYTDDAVVVGADGTRLYGVQAIYDDAARLVPVDFAVERVAPVTTEGTYATTFVHWTSRVQEGTRAVVAELANGRISGMVVVELGPGFPLDVTD
jgi:uncharacterized protein (TIGR02246 family)